MDIYLSSSIYKNINEAVKFANDNRLNLEISRFGNLQTLDSYYDGFLEHYKKALVNFKGKLTLHGFFLDLNVAAQDPLIQRISERRFQQSFNVARALNAKTVVFHSGFNGLVKHPAYYRGFINSKIKFWKKFIKQFENAGITAVLENTYENTPDILIDIVENVCSDNLKLCIDTGHVNINSSKSCAEWIKAFGNNLHHMHLHNNFGSHDDHNSVLNGTIDFNEVLNTLLETGISPNLVVEIFDTTSAMESVEFINNNLVTVKV